MNFSSELQDTIRIAKEAGRIILDYYNKDIGHRLKSDRSPVTDADIAADIFIRQELARKYPYPVLSEETKDDLSRLKSDYLWLVDPLDGTKDFVAKTGSFSVVIGLTYKSRPACGVVYKPTTGECWFAERGQGAYKEINDQNSQKLHVSDRSTLDELKFIVSGSNQETALFIEEYLGVREYEKIGGFALKAMAVAEGKFDIYINPAKGEGGEWDECAPDIILEEAGGIITDLRGARFKYNQEKFVGGGYVISNGGMHAEIIKLIAPHVRG